MVRALFDTNILIGYLGGHRATKIWATAQVHSMLLVSRNTKDFPADAPGVRVPYR